VIPEGTDVTIALKFLGSVTGAILSLVFLLPKSLPELLTRVVFALISGTVFADPARGYLKWDDTWQMQIASASAVAALGWFIMGAIVKAISMWKPKA